MKICILDLEMNKPSRSIIEIGAVCLDLKSGQMSNTFRTYVDPKEVIDPFITQLTGITQLDVDGEPSLTEALNSFVAWMTKVGCQKTVGAWGSDWHMVLNEFKKHGIEFEHPKHIDIKVMGMVLRCAFPNTKSKSGLANTCALFNIDMVGKQHRALDDALNTAKLLYKFKQMTEVYNQINSLMGKS